MHHDPKKDLDSIWLEVREHLYRRMHFLMDFAMSAKSIYRLFFKQWEVDEVRKIDTDTVKGFQVDIQVSDKPTKGISFCSFVKSNWNLSGIEKETPDLQEKLDELVSGNYSIFSVTGCAATGANSEEYNPYVEISWKRRGANHEELKQNIMTITESDLSALFTEMMIKFANVPKTG